MFASSCRALAWLGSHSSALLGSSSISFRCDPVSGLSSDMSQDSTLSSGQYKFPDS